MSDTVSNWDGHAGKPPPKRRRVLHPSDIKPVQVYSNKVSSCLHLKPSPAVFAEKDVADDAADLWAEFSSQETRPPVICVSDSDDEAERRTAEDARCPSPPPPPESPTHKQSRKVARTISKVNRRLRAVSAVLSPETPSRRSRRHPTPPSPLPVAGQEDDDLVVTSDPHSSAREIPLKVRCRTDVHKIPVLPASPLSEVVRRLSVILDVPPPRLLLLREDEELSPGCTVGELGLGIADIIECVVMAAEDGGGAITVRLQSRNRDSSQEFTIHREAPLDAVFSRYLSSMSAAARRKVCFHFDGSKVLGSQTPAQLDMEDGDIIEVWL